MTDTTCQLIRQCAGGEDYYHDTQLEYLIREREVELWQDFMDQLADKRKLRPQDREAKKVEYGDISGGGT